MNQKKAVFVVPYFGKFHAYFQLTLNSMRTNQDFDWIIFTDSAQYFDYPSNVHVIKWSFEQLKVYIQKKFDFVIALDKPYKLCDFKPAYGYIFEEYIDEYAFWGYCDVDCIFGKLSNFLTEDLWKKYDKIFELGHMTLYRNTKENNIRFRLPLNGKLKYQEVFSSNEKFIFDEGYNGSICNIYHNYNFSYFRGGYCADIAQKSCFFNVTELDAQTHQYITSKRIHQVFWWDNGILKLSYCDHGQYREEEKIYIHLIRRTNKMKVRFQPSEGCRYKIIPHEFVLLKEVINEENYRKCKWWNFNLHYFYIRFCNMKSKLYKKWYQFGPRANKEIVKKKVNIQ